MANVDRKIGSADLIERFINFAGSRFARVVAMIPYNSSETELFTAANPGSVGPMSAILEGGLTELVGTDEEVNTDDYGASVGVALGGTYSGEILSVGLYATEEGTGAVQDSAGVLFIFDADPTISAGDTAMAAAEWQSIIGRVDVAAADWKTDANGGMAYFVDVPIPFHAVGTLYFVWFHEDGTDLNDAAGDDEVLEMNFWYRRDS